MTKQKTKKLIEHILVIGGNLALLVIGIVEPWLLIFAALITWFLLGAILYSMYRHEEG
jgi:predicted membrane protein